MDEILAAGRTPIVVGGTGLYFRAALAELDVPARPAPGERERWERFYDRVGAQEAHRLLAERDVAAAAAVHPNDRRRVVRALELAEAGSSLRPPRNRLWARRRAIRRSSSASTCRGRSSTARIEERTRAMFEGGVVEEVQRALDAPLSATARRVLGLLEVAELSRDEAAAALVRRTRQLAAYQRKWMRRIPGLVSVRADRPSTEVADEIVTLARARERVPARRAGRGG